MGRAQRGCGLARSLPSGYVGALVHAAAGNFLCFVEGPRFVALGHIGVATPLYWCRERLARDAPSTRAESLGSACSGDCQYIPVRLPRPVESRVLHTSCHTRRTRMSFCVSGHGVVQTRCAAYVVCLSARQLFHARPCSLLLFDRPCVVFHARVCDRARRVQAYWLSPSPRACLPEPMHSRPPLGQRNRSRRACRHGSLKEGPP